MQIYCPRCANPAPQGQRFCRACGMKLDIIVDAMEGRRGTPIDFDAIKADLIELGANLRVGFEQVRENIKQTNKLNQTKNNLGNFPTGWWTSNPTEASAESAPAAPAISAPVERELRKTIKALRRSIDKVKAAHSRKYSLQQATLQLFSGAAMAGVWYFLLDHAQRSGLLDNLVQALTAKLEITPVGLVPVIANLWVLALLPMAAGAAHLINGIFFAPKAEELLDDSFMEEPLLQNSTQPPLAAPVNLPNPVAYSAAASGVNAAVIPAVPTNELGNDTEPAPVASMGMASVTEDETRRFVEPQQQNA